MVRIALSHWSWSTKLTYAKPGYYWDGWLCPGSTPGGKTLFWYVTSHIGWLSLLRPWCGKMSTSQSLVMICGWGVKAGVARVQVNCVLPYLSTLENVLVFKGTLQMSRFTLLVAMYCKLCDISTYGHSGLRKVNEHPIYILLWGMLSFIILQHLYIK